jgi:catechol 2,3-dioxygenase-like lactoylglutathione lyase family enzyme
MNRQKSPRWTGFATRLVVWTLLFVPAGWTAASEPLVTAVESVGFTVSDADRAVGFFTDVLEFEKISDIEVQGAEYEHLQGVFGLRMRVVRLRLGHETIELTEYLTPEGRPYPAGTRSNDRWFQHIAIVVRNMDAAYQRLRRHHVRHASTGPQRLPDWNTAAGGIEAFYFRDPDGHFLELISFPPGKGDPRWSEPGDDLFLGIDHTAIVVADTERSLEVYGNVLGLKVAGHSENYGIEQERLNNVFGARLRITGLRAAGGPGIEFLEYLAPRDGRAAPDDVMANDLVHWQTHLAVTDADRAAASVDGRELRWVSPGAVSLADPVLGFDRGMLVRDPDGHGLLLVAGSSRVAFRHPAADVRCRASSSATAGCSD